MIAKLRKTFNKPFVQNVFVLVTGTAAAQAITLISMPVITRLYGPEAFGILGAFNALIMILAPVAALTYPIAIVLPRKDDEAKSIVRLSLIISLMLSLCIWILLLLFNVQIVNFFNLNQISSYLYLLPLVLLFSSLDQVSEQWLIRRGQFQVNAKVKVIQSLIINISKIAFGLFKPIAIVLIIIQSFGSGLKAYLYHFFSKKELYIQMKNYEEKKTYMASETAKKYYDFPLYRSPQVLLNGISMSLPVLMLTTFFGPISAGFFTLSRTALSAPTQLLGKSVSDVFYPRISKAAQSGEDVTELLIKASISLFLIGIIPFGTVILFGPFLFTIVFGSEWAVAGEYARWITVWVLFSFVNRPSVMTLPVLNAQVFHLAFTALMLISNALMLFIGYYFYANDIIAVRLVGISGGVFSLGLILLTIYLSKRAQIEKCN